MNVFTCPICGGEVKTKARVCPHCGSDEKTGWSENTYLDEIGLYDEDDYEETIRREFGIRRSNTRLNKKQLLISFMAAIFLLLFLLRFVFRIF